MKYVLCSLTLLVAVGCGLARLADSSRPTSPQSTASCANADPSDTLAWIDNTYHPHEGWASGHGSQEYSNGSGEVLLRFTETFAVSGCQLITLEKKDSPDSKMGRIMYRIPIRRMSSYP
jgi:hypothetical protein